MLRRWTIFVLAVMLLQGCDPAGDDLIENGELPNIVWITAEDMSADLGAYGDSYATTPNIDRLASEGVTYTNAFATAPVCSPARFTLITGIYATTAGTQGLRSGAPIPDDVTGFPAFLREQGYYTTNNVKTDYNTADEARLIEASWDESSATAHWRGRQDDQPFFAVFNHMHTHQSRISFLDTEFEEIEGSLGTHDPDEAPLPPYYPDEPEVRQTVARYYDAITAMDESVGRILNQLEEDGVADNTIVFFYSDHGVGLPRGKRVLYDSGLHVPLIVHFPAKWSHLAPGEPGTRTDRLVSFVDFAPTVLSLLGLDIPEYMQGEVFLGENANAPRDYIFGARDRVDEAYDVARAVRDKQYLYIRHYHPHRSWNQPEFFSDQAPIRQVITRRAEQGALDDAQMSYAGPSKPVEELFDVEADPDQIDNLATATEHQDRLARYRDVLKRWQTDTHDLGFMPEGMVLRQSEEGSTPLEFGDEEQIYPLERVLDTATLVGDVEAVGTLGERLSAPNGAVRYWAAVGLHAAGDRAAPEADALQQALNDEVPEVRIESAAALARLDQTDQALATLVELLKSDDSHVVLMAARTLQFMGEKAAPAHEAMETVLAKAQDDSAYGVNALYIRFSLEPPLSVDDGATEVH